MILRTFVVFSLICLLNSQEMPKMDTFSNFHSRVAVRQNDAGFKMVTFVEEYWDSKQQRGRLDVTRQNITTFIVYDLKTRQYSQIIGYNCLTATLPNYDITAWDDNLSDEAIIDVDGQNPLIIGPTAAWRKSLRASESKKTTLNNNEEVRGMPANSWSFTDNELNFKIYFAADNWKTSAKEAPLRLTISGTYDGKKSIDFVFDYYVFEKFDYTYYPFLPIVGIGCSQTQNTPGTVMPKIPWSDFSTELEIFEQTDFSDGSFGFGPLKVKIFVDLKNNVSRTDVTFLLSRESVVHDLNRGIIYNKKPNGDCFINPDDAVGLDLIDNVAKIKTLNQLLLLDRDYYYIGLAFVRGVFTSVWESTSYNETVDEQLMNKVVISYYVTATQGEILDSLGNQLPLKFVRTGYTLNKNGQYQLALKQEFNMFNFQKLYYGKNFQDVFNIENCIIEETDKKYFVFSSLLDEHLKVMDRRYAPRYANVIKRRLTDILNSQFGVFPLRVPSIDFNYQNKNIRIEALVLERPSSLSSFERKEKKKPNKKDKPFAKKSLEQCADSTLYEREKSTGFKYCDGNCFIMEYDPKEEYDPIQDTECEVHILRSLNVERSVLKAEPNSVKLIDSLFKAKNLSIDVTDWKNKTLIIPIDDIVVSDDTTNLMNSELLYTRTVAAKRVKVIDTTIEFEGSTLGDCYTFCKNDKDLQCQTFSFCKSGEKKCRLSSVLISDDTDQEFLDNNTETADECNVYAMNYMNKYEKVAGERGLLKGFVPLKSFNYAHECARACSTEGPCASFQFCESGNCALSIYAFQDFDDEDLTTAANNETCTVYEAKDVNLFVYTGNDLVAQNIESTITDIGVEDCAKRCYEMTQESHRDCLSFNYCPTSAAGARSSCQLSTASVQNGANVTKSVFCKNFERNVAPKNKTVTPTDKPIVPDNREQSSSQASGKMTSRSFMGLIFGMFFVGLILGIVGFLGYRAYQRRREENDGFGVSVRFIRHQDE